MLCFSSSRWPLVVSTGTLGALPGPLWLWLPSGTGVMGLAGGFVINRLRYVRSRTTPAARLSFRERALQYSLAVSRLQFLLPGRDPGLLLALLFIGAMAAIGATGDGAEHAVMSGIMTGDAADRGAPEATLGIGRRGGSERQHGDGEDDGGGFHDSLPKMLPDNRRRAPRFPGS